jgi:hypothetical protein
VIPGHCLTLPSPTMPFKIAISLVLIQPSGQALGSTINGSAFGECVYLCVNWCTDSGQSRPLLANIQGICQTLEPLVRSRSNLGCGLEV